MPYRPQYAYPAPPPGWHDEEFEYYFDSTNTPALQTIPSNLIPLNLQKDAEYRFRAIQFSGNSANLAVRFWTPDNLQLSQTPIESDLAYAGTLGAPNPVGRLPVPLDEIVCPAGSQLFIDIAAM
jgi:hypothetical protein